MRLISSEAIVVATIWQEARSEPFEGKVAVAEVIRNRMSIGGHYGDGTVEGTCLKAMQFSGWNAHDPNRVPSMRIDGNDPVVQECLRAWLVATQEPGSDLTHGATLYVNLETFHPSWSDRAIPLVKIGRHSFYRE